MTIEDPLLNAIGYQLLLLVTCQIAVDNRKIDVSDIFRGVLLIVEQDNFRTLKIYHWVPLVNNCCSQQPIS